MQRFQNQSFESFQPIQNLNFFLHFGQHLFETFHKVEIKLTMSRANSTMSRSNLQSQDRILLSRD